MSHCILCGNSLGPNAKFCGKCGTLVSDAHKGEERHLDTTCRYCGNILPTGKKFCTHCGKPAQLTVANQISSVSMPEKAVTGTPVRKSGWRKAVAISVTVVIISTIAAMAIYYFGSYEPQGDVPSDLTALYNEYPVDINRIDSAASITERVFLDADTVALAGILTPTTLSEKRPYFAQLQPHMHDYGQVFRNRKLLYATALFAVYEFETTKGAFTAEFCLAEDGKWKLMRF